jgi:hypothetical protein
MQWLTAFSPMDKREFERTGKATYKGKDIFRLDGVTLFDHDTNEAVACLSNLAYGKPDYR